MENREKYVMKEADRLYITHKYYNPDKPHDGYKRFTYLGHDCDPATGLSDAELRAKVHELAGSQPKELDHAVAKAEALALVFDNTRIDVSDNDYFAGFHSWGRVIFPDYPERWQNELFNSIMPETRDLMNKLRAAGLSDNWLDYDHAVPDWDAIFRLGFPGLRQRAADCRRKNEEKGELTDGQKAFYDSIEIAFSAMLRLIGRMRDYAAQRNGEKFPKIAKCLGTLLCGAPTDTYEALQLMYLYFMFSESVDCYQVRSLGNGFDRIIAPFYEKDLKSGKYTAAELDDFIAYFLMQFYAIGNYWGQPLFMGGTNPDGSTKYTPFAVRVLQLWDDLGIHNPKIQLVVGESTPKDVRYLIYDIIRRGKYFTLVGEEGARTSVKTGFDCTDEEAKDFIVSGCYEPLVRGGTLIENGYPNLAKLVSVTLRDGFDCMTKTQVGLHTGRKFDTFDDFFAAFEQQFKNLFDTLRGITNTTEKYLTFVNPAIMLSATKEESLIRMEDGYAMTDPKATTLFELNAYGSAVDALVAIKRLVFDEKAVTLDRLVEILDNNWKGEDALRRHVLADIPKYGNAVPESDEIAHKVAALVPKYILCHRNLRGARFVVEFHGAMEYAWQGDLTEATADGRRKGEELSKNASPSVGSDKKGATAFIRSCTNAIRPEYAPAGFNADVMLHPSALEGEEGLIALDALMTVYRKRGGIDIQFNVVSADTLRDAQKHPERYQNLQIRVSGWNVLWNDIPPKLQEGYILRAESAVGM
ncbi:MAG: hypothetical protein MJ082_00625 [Clostridia bacterium]|nr:hypothetical protein [Clostridia bacterium]